MNSLKLTIRCAHQTNADLKIEEARSDWTVRQLKIYLSDVHPSKPAPERQRIVFAGQLLRDEARLGDYFDRYDSAGSGKTPEPYVLHLVYTISAEANVAAAEDRAKKETELRQRKPPANSPSQQNGPESFTGGSPHPINSYGWIPDQRAYLGTTPVADDWMRQQQQLYAAMMSQWYGQYMQAAYGSVGFYPASPTQQQNADLGSVAQQQQHAEPVAQHQEAPRPQAPPQPAMNAQGGLAPADDEDDPRNRDWLDYVYMACRASLLLMILYFYSSVERFVFVLLCCTLMYGLQAGWFGRRGQQDEQRRADGQAAPNAAQGPQQHNGLQNRADQAVREGNVERPADGPVQENQVERGQDAPRQQTVPQLEMPMTAWNVFWTTCWTFVSSFFASLVPERPPPLNF